MINFQSEALPSDTMVTPQYLSDNLNEYITILINLRLHPLGPKPKVPGAHLSQVLPTTFGRHWHWPPLGSQTELKEP